MYQKKSGNFFDQGKLYLDNKINKIKTIFTEPNQSQPTAVEGFSGILGSNDIMNAKNDGEYAKTNSQVASLTNNLAQYASANTNLQNKTSEYLANKANYSTSRNFNMFVNQYTDTDVTSISKCVKVNDLTELSNGNDFAAAYPVKTGQTSNFDSFVDARDACKTWAADTGNTIFSLSKNTGGKYSCYVGSDAQASSVQYTNPVTAYNLTGAVSATATSGGLFANGLIGVKTDTGAPAADDCNISKMTEPYKQTRFDNPNNNPWFGSSDWGKGFIPEETAHWIWPNSSAADVRGYGKYMYYNYINTNRSTIIAKVYCVADNYADLKLNGTVIFTNVSGKVPLTTVSLKPGPNIFEIQPGNTSGPGGIVFVVQGDVGDGNGIKTLFKSGDIGWGVATGVCNYSQLTASNGGRTVAANPLNINYFSEYDLTSAGLSTYAKCDPINGGDIYQPSIQASFGRNCSNMTVKPVVVRYIKINNRPTQVPGIGSPMQFAQVVVMGYSGGQLVNLATNGRPGNTVGGSVTAYSNYGNYGSQVNAIDGNQSAKGWPNIYHSQGEGPEEYWQLDLGKSYPITQIIFYNRGDCCQERSNGATMELWNSPPAAGATPVQTITLNAGLKQVFNINPAGNSLDCSVYGANDTNLPAACITPLWTAAGCTTNPTAANYTSWAPYSKSALVSSFADTAVSPTPSSRTLCYGTDKTKWPALDPNKYEMTVGNNVSISCNLYCKGFDGHAWQNGSELKGWKGATCAASGENMDQACNVKSNRCLCKRDDAAGFYGGSTYAVNYLNILGN
jgi:hypothetical protein